MKEYIFELFELQNFKYKNKQMFIPHVHTAGEKQVGPANCIVTVTITKLKRKL